MPNWCDNVVYVERNKKTKPLERFITPPKPKENQAERYLLSEFVKRDDKKHPEYAHMTDREWAEKNWGTKLDVDMDEASAFMQKDTIKIHFMTAWAPPLEFLKRLSAMFKTNVLCYYSEPGESFSGMYWVNCGLVEVNVNGKYEEYQPRPFKGFKQLREEYDGTVL